MTAETVSSNRCFGGWQHHVRHASQALNCTMRFALYLPPQAEQEPVPAVYWLSGLTCTDENFAHKAGAQRVAAELGVALVAPDTSPRGEGVPDDPDGAYDFGLGAGFYVNATQPPFDQHYRMYDYVTRELPALVESEFAVSGERRAISGHSMGGHGALVAALSEPDRYTSVTAFAPIVNPTEVPWGDKAFTGYLGEDREAWKAYDSCELMRRAEAFVPALVDQGDADGFLQQQLQPEQLKAVAEERGYPLTLRWQPGYDHSYYFISTFIEEHLRFHADCLRA